MSQKAVSYIEAVKKKPGLLIHLSLFGVMCLLNYGVWESLESVLPESTGLGHKAIVGESVTVFIIIVMAVRGTSDVAKRALILLVAATVLTVFNFGIHWFYSRDLAMANKYVAYLNSQKVTDSNLANQQAQRVEGVLGKLTEFNKSQTQLSKADQAYYERTGQKRVRKVQLPPDINELGIIVNPSPSPTPVPVQGNGLVVSGSQESIVKIQAAKPLTPDEVPVKWSPWFLFGAMSVLAVVFCGAAYVAATWEWDMDGDGLKDTPGKG